MIHGMILRATHKHFTIILLILWALAAPSHLQAKNLTQLANFRPQNYELLDVELVGNLAYIPGGLLGLDIIDISDPAAPRSISQIQIEGCAWGRVYAWHVSSNYAYGSGRECGIRILNVSNVNLPSDIGSYRNQDGSYEHADGWQDFLFAAVHALGVEVIDRSDPTALAHIKWVNTENAWAVTVSADGQYLYVADGAAGLKIIDIRDPQAAVVVGQAAASGTAKDIATAGNFLFVAVGAKGVDMFDVSRHSTPRLVANYNTSGYASRVSVSGNLVAVSDWDDVEVLEWDPTPALRLVGYKNTGGRVMALAMRDSVIYSAEWERFRTFKYGEIEEADLDISTRQVDFPFLTAPACLTDTITLTNNGHSILILDDVSIQHDDYQLDLQANSIPPLSSQELVVTYCASDGAGRATLLITSNDPDESIASVRLNGNPVYGLDIGMDAPDFTLEAVNRLAPVTLSDFRGQPVLLAFFATW
ncbi:MAG: hypothetical protein IIA60_01090 [Candidatus Marinimicrobia bacterium]|nr:hypothetical protein [Candidatus Neomarinimicrobiota bacterium]